MSKRDVLSPITNTPIVRPSTSSSKFVSPSPSRNSNLTSPTPLLTRDRDDTAERKERRRSRVLDLQRRNLASPNTPDRRRSLPPSGLTNNQLSEHYASCIKLSTENKINAKNAFSLQLIDYMSELLKKEKMENFQIASSTLDASAKIYAGRVDCIHAEAYKVLSGLGRGANKPSDEDGEVADEEHGEEGTGGDNPDQRKKKKKVRKSRTVETNLKNISVNKFDLEFEVDPMFQVMSAAFDEGGASGLILNNLRCYDDCQELVLDSSTLVSVVESKGPELTPKCLNVTDLKDLLEKLDCESKQVCAPYAEFQFTDWDGSDMSSMLGKGASEHAFDMNAEREPIFPDADDDDHQSLPPDTDYGDMAEGGSDNEDGGGFEDDGERSNVVGDSRAAMLVQSAFEDLTHGSSGTLMQILASQPSDYSYFNKALMQTWAGPSHWRRGCLSKDAKFKSLNKSQKNKTKKVAFRVNYHEKADTDASFKASKATALTKTTLSRYSKDQTTLPEDLHYDADKLFRPFLKPKIMVKRQQGSSVGVDDEIDNYDYNNENDRENFCADLGGDDDDEDGGGGFDFNLTAGDYSHASSQDNISQPSLAYNDSLNATSLCGDKLLSQPYKVAKIDIAYAKTAKKLDVRKLKGAMWNLLTTPVSKQEETSGHPDHTLMEPPPSTSAMNEMWTFQTLLTKLPGKVSSNTAKNLSVPIAFVCLLHLANEKTLKILDSNLEDLQISQGI
ncbi:condensin complex subunit 2-like [Haliotis asinina]|uniref:condensin complex subunit 2-like n=1 Tax=Haliotis asinina TaxID=109174 RepID=UPI0035318089